MLRKRLIDPDTPFELSVEPLEQRRMLAGNVVVDVNGDDLSIRGDTADNELEVHVTGGTIWVTGVNGTTLVGDANGAGNDFDTGIAAKGLDNFKAILKKGNDRLILADSMQINGRATVSLGSGNDAFLIDGATGRSTSNFTIRGASGNDLVELDGWKFDGTTKVALSGGNDTLGIGVGSTEFTSPKTRLIGGGGVDELAPLAGDSDFGTIPLGVDLVVTTGDVLSEFAPGAVGIETLGVVQKSFETVTSDANLTASDITFTSATLDGAVSSLSQVGFSYSAGAGSDGVLVFATDGAPGFAGLGAAETANVEVAFTFTVAGQAEAGLLKYSVSATAEDYEATVDFLGPAIQDQPVEATVVAAVGEALLDVNVLGRADLSQTVAAIDFLAPTAALNGLADNSTLTIAGAFAAEGADATATATNRSIAMAAADDLSSATAVAVHDSVTTATAVQQSTVFASGSDRSSATSFGGDNGTANAVAEQASIANAVAINGSAASAFAVEGSDSLSFANVGSAADSDAVNASSAAATAETSSVATANAQAGSTATASSIQIGSATAVASEDSVATAAATDTSVATAFATVESAASSTAEATSDAQTVAQGGSSAAVTATDFGSATASAEDATIATAQSMGFMAASNTATVVPATAFADDFSNPVETVLFSGLPVGTVLSGGTSNADGTEWTFAGPPPAGLTLTTPAGFIGTFALNVMATDGTAIATSVQTVVVS
jgi:hypothetical protein